jgi:hypothetical protein
MQRVLFKNVKIKKGNGADTLIGKDQTGRKKAIAIVYPNAQLDLKIVDYGVLIRRTPNNKMRYVKIIDNPGEGNFGDYILASEFYLFPIKFKMGNTECSITQFSRKWAGYCDNIKIQGFKDYSLAKIVDYKYDNVKKEQIFNLELSNGKITRNIIITRNNAGKVLSVNEDNSK